MKVFKHYSSAIASKGSKDSFYLNSYCPYSEKEKNLCGNWCALFYFSPKVKNEYKNTSAYVILGCKAGEKLLYVEKLVED